MYFQKILKHFNNLSLLDYKGNFASFFSIFVLNINPLIANPDTGLQLAAILDFAQFYFFQNLRTFIPSAIILVSIFTLEKLIQ